MSVNKDLTFLKNSCRNYYCHSNCRYENPTCLWKRTGIYHNGDTIKGKLSESIITKFETELVPIKEKVTGMIIELDSVMAGINDIMSPDSGKT